MNDQQDTECLGAGCDWQRVGSRWVPSFSNWPHDGVHDIEVEYMDYRCRLCGRELSEERAYSQRKRVKHTKIDVARVAMDRMVAEGWD